MIGRSCTGVFFQLSAVQLRMRREVPVIHGECVDGHGGVAISSLRGDPCMP